MRQFLLIASLALMLGLTPSGQAAETPATAQLKVAYLYNFAKFVRWPTGSFSNPDSPLVIGVYGQQALNNTFEKLTSRRVRNRPLQIQVVEDLNDISNIHILYIDSSAPSPEDAILKKYQNKPVLTVGSGQNFAEQGGIIQFVMKRERLRFIINLNVAKGSGIKIDSQLIPLAAKVLEAKR